jgi:hypothetical protein
VGARATVLGVPVVDAAVEGAYDGSKSFATPVCQGTSFPIPTVDIPPQLTGLYWSFFDTLAVGIGLSINPHLTAGGVTSDWFATGDAVGSGQLTYNSCNLPVSFASISTGNFSPTTSYATIRLNSFRYHFGQFTLQLGGYLQFELFGYGIKTGIFALPDFDLTPLTGGLWLSTHAGTRPYLEESFLVAKTADYVPVMRR